jgi:hypothetical protein
LIPFKHLELAVVIGDLSGGLPGSGRISGALELVGLSKGRVAFDLGIEALGESE